MRIFFFLWIIQGFAAFNLTWGIPATSLDSNPPLGDTDANASVAMDSNGNCIATWSRTEGAGATEAIWASIYHHAARTWTGALKISGGGNAANSRVALDEEGNALFVWEEGFPAQILSRSLSASGVWTPPLSNPPASICHSTAAQSNPELALQPTGKALLIWKEISKELYHLYSAHKTAQGKWEPLGRLSSLTQSAYLNPHKSLKINEKGEGIAAWEEFNGQTSEIHAAQYTGETWQSPLIISPQNGYAPAVGLDAQGKGLIVWAQEGQILSRTLFQDQLSPLLLVSDPAYPAQRPDLELAPSGNAVAVFERADGLHKFIASASFPLESDHWLPPHDLSGPSPLAAEAAGYPILFLNKRGDGVVIWKESTGNHMIVQGAGYSLGTWSYIKTLSSSEHNAGAPFPTYDIDVAVNAAGNIIAIWPEDPSEQGSHQIKATLGAGLANIAPLPPVPLIETIQEGIVYGKQVIQKFPAHTDVINILEWAPRAEATQYKIYRGAFSNLIGTSEEPRFEDHQRDLLKQEIYLITSVNSHNQESSPITLIVEPLPKSAFKR